MIYICTSGYGNRSVLRQLQRQQVWRPEMYATQFQCEDGRVFNGELWADSLEEAELVARALGVEVLGPVIKEIEANGANEPWETNNGTEPPEV